jgi:NADH-quinone oxidoreductase subunit H
MFGYLRDHLWTPLAGAALSQPYDGYAVYILDVIAKILVVLIPLLVVIAFTTYVERKVLGAIHLRIGPNRVGIFGIRIFGLAQPFADAVKGIFKEIIIPSGASKFLFIIAPILAVAPAFAAWAVIPFGDVKVISDINIGVLYIITLTSLAVYGIIIAGWASNSKYAFLGALRSSAQIVSYELAMGFALVGVLIAAGSLNLGDIVAAQSGNLGFFNWYWIPLLPMFYIYFVSGLAETNRLPFDVTEGESEIVAGYFVEYNSWLYSIFMMAEYANMILISMMASIMFMGGWLSPFQGIPVIGAPNILWLLGKAAFFLFLFLWIRGTLPRYRYDQIMRLGWKVFLPITIVWIFVTAVMVILQLPPWFSQ